MRKGGFIMGQILKCRDIGLICNSVICGETKKEVLKKARTHAEFMHYIKGNPKGLYEKAWPAIHEGDCDRETGEACPSGLCRV